MIKKILSISLLTASLLAGTQQIGYQKIKVTKSEPIYSTQTENVPYENCYDVKEDASTGGNSVLGTIAGGVIGGAVGHQFGGGSGKTIATVGGAVLGSVIGNNVASEPKQESYKIVKKCDVNYKTVTKNVITGYSNYGRYNGVEIIKESSSPLEYIEAEIFLEY